MQNGNVTTSLKTLSFLQNKSEYFILLKTTDDNTTNATRDTREDRQSRYNRYSETEIISSI